MMGPSRLKHTLSKLRSIQLYFKKTYGVDDVLSNSKTYEVLMADSLGHTLIPGHAGSRDAKDAQGEYEYKHFKETSSNHSWTFNDYSDAIIQNLKRLKAVIFSHIDDTQKIPRFDWYYLVPGDKISAYMAKHTRSIKNTRRMINVSPKQIEERLKISRTNVKKTLYLTGAFSDKLKEIFQLAQELETITGVKQVLTSNKLWELLAAEILGHRVLSDQAKYDAKDKRGKYYEYKIAKTASWNFEDISAAVLRRQAKNDIVLGIVDKQNLKITELYIAPAKQAVARIREKLKNKKQAYKQKKKELRRLQISLSRKDLSRIGAMKINI